MPFVPLELFKRHVRADDFAQDDTYLEHLIRAAEVAVLNYLHRTVDELVEIGGGHMPPDIIHATMLLGGTWYDRRESVASVQSVQCPDTLAAILKHYRKLEA